MITGRLQNKKTKQTKNPTRLSKTEWGLAPPCLCEGALTPGTAHPQPGVAAPGKGRDPAGLFLTFGLNELFFKSDFCIHVSLSPFVPHCFLGEGGLLDRGTCMRKCGWHCMWSDGTVWGPLPLPVLMPRVCDLGEAIRSSQIKRKLSSLSAARTLGLRPVAQGAGRPQRLEAWGLALQAQVGMQRH